MPARKWTLCVLTCVLNCSACGGVQQITVKTGDDVTLQCRDPKGGDIQLLEWRRLDLEEDVFACRPGKSCVVYHSFKTRVQLRDPEKKDGDVSVILKNVNIDDAGTYECYVKSSNTYIPQLICIITLTVVDSEIKTNPGEDILLPCQGPRDANIILLRWSRPDLEPKGLVFFYRDKRIFEDHQYESFRGRVELRDPEMKDGNVSVILKNVNVNDTGTYECYVRITGGSLEHISSTHLTVAGSGGDEDGGDKDGGDNDEGDKDGGDKDGGDEDGGDEEGGDEEGGDEEGGDKEGGSHVGYAGLAVGLSVVGVFIVVGVVVGVVIYRKRVALTEQILYEPSEQRVETQIL